MESMVKARKSVKIHVWKLFTSTWKKLSSDEVLLTISQKIGIAGVFTLISGILIEAVILPSMLKSSLQKNVALATHSRARETWNKFPFTCELHVYVFNVMNPEGIANGEKPILEEVGPFVYDVWHEKTNVIDNEEDDTVTYSVNNTYFFNAQKSNNISDDTEFTLVDFLTFGTPNGAMKDHTHLIGPAMKAVDSVGRNATSLFMRQSVKTFLFDGQYIYCEGVTEVFGRILCNGARDNHEYYRVGKSAEDVYYYSMFGLLNKTDIYHGRIRIQRGTRKLSEVGNVVEFNGSKNMSTWKNDECDQFRGTEGTMFHPFLNKKKDQYLYVTHTFYCRTLTYKYESKVEYKGLKLLRYTTTIGTEMATNNKDSCYCISPNQCLKDGVYDAFRCTNNPYVISNPHFYLADESYIDGVEGVSPDKDEHMIILDVDPLTGLAVRTHFRIQYNLMLMNLTKYRLLSGVRDAMFPLIWTDEVMILPDFVIKRIKKIHTMVIIMRVIGYVTILIGLALCGYASFFRYQLMKKNDTKSLQI